MKCKYCGTYLEDVDENSSNGLTHMVECQRKVIEKQKKELEENALDAKHKGGVVEDAMIDLEICKHCTPVQRNKCSLKTFIVCDKYVKALEDIVRGYRSKKTDKEWAEIAQEHKNEARRHWKEVERLRKIIDSTAELKCRMKKVAISGESREIPVSVCDYCEETYPESWVVDGICPFCGHAHNEEDEEAVGFGKKTYASYCPVCDQYLPDGLGIVEDIILSSGSIEIDMKNSVALNVIGKYVHNLMKESGAPNFLTSEIGEVQEVGTFHLKRHRVYMTFGWANKKTPAQAITELREKVAVYERALAEKRTYAMITVNELAQVLVDLGFPRWNEYGNCESLAQAIMDKAEVVVSDEYDWIRSYDLLHQNPQQFLDKLHFEWKHDYGRMSVTAEKEYNKVVLELSTGGWSENEEIISAMRMNFVLWSLCWIASKRGGYYKFEFPVK